jgi:DNA-binding transcriptional regulator YdaS (Cro superfamily)
MKLSDYLELGNIDAAAFAARINVTPKAVSYWISGDRTPRPEQMQKIIDATNGAVTPNDFLALPFRDQNQGAPSASGEEAIAQETEEVAGAAQ